MEDHLKKLREQQKATLQQNDQPEDEFLTESAEGWAEAGFADMDKVMASIDARIDKEVTGQDSTAESAPAKVVSFSSPNITKYVLGIAATLVLAVVAVFFFNKRGAVQKQEQLFAMYYQPLEAPEKIYRGENTGTDNKKEQQASSSYGSQQYDLSIRYYKELLAEYPNDPKYTLFLGLSLMQEERYDEAIALFNTHVPSNTSYDEDIQWYLALAQLKKGNLNTARTMLEKLQNSPGSYYNESAGQIIARMPVR